MKVIILRDEKQEKQIRENQIPQYQNQQYQNPGYRVPDYNSRYQGRSGDTGMYPYTARPGPRPGKNPRRKNRGRNKKASTGKDMSSLLIVVGMFLSPQLDPYRYILM